VHVKWFGAAAPAGFTSAWHHWRYLGVPQELDRAPRLLARLCDLRLPLTLDEAACVALAAQLRAAAAEAAA